MLGYQTIYEKSMNGIKTISDGKAKITNGNLNADNITATNIIATNISGLLTTINQPNITNIGTLTTLDVSGNTTLNTLNVSGNSTVKALTTDSIIQTSGSTLTQSGLGRIVQSGVTSGNLNIMAGMSLNSNADIYLSGTGKIEQVGTGTNIMKTINMTSNSNIVTSGTGIISQSGSAANALKATNIIGELGLTGNLTQTSGSNTFKDSTFTNINQTGNSKLTQAIGGTGINALNKTTITDLTVTNSMTIPSGLTMPSATFNGDTSYIGTAKIIQSGSTGINDMNGSSFNGNISVTGNFNMTGGSASSTLKTPTISGTTTLDSIVQNSGTSSLRALTTNQIDVNPNYNLYTSGSGILSQTGTGTNIIKSTNITGQLGLAGNINQTSGSNTFLDSTMGNITMPIGKTMTFNDGLSRKIQLHSSVSYYGAYAFDINNSMIRYNVDYNSHHVFTNANSSRTDFVELARINNTGLGIGITPSYKLHVLGSTKLDGINLFTTSLNGITPLQFSYLDATSSIQTQLNDINIVGNTNGAQIALLNTKTTDQSYTTGLTTFSSSVNIASILYLIGNLIVGGQTLTPVQLSYLANVTSNIQTQLNTLSDLRITNTNNINTLITKTTDLSYGSSVSTFANNVNVNGNLTVASNKSLIFSASVGQKLIIHPGPTTFSNYMISVEQNTFRHNIDYLGSHKFSMANTNSGTSFIDMLIVQISGTILNTNLTVNGNINGITPTIISYLDATSSIQNQLTTLQTKTSNLTTSLFNGSVNGTINGILPAVFAFLDPTSSIQAQFNTLYGYGVSNNTNVTSLFNKTTDLTYASSVSTFANQLNVNGNLTVAGNKTLTFLSSTTQKIVLYPSTTLFNNYMIAIEPATIRYNTDFNGAHLFSGPNTYPSGTAFIDYMKITSGVTTIYTPTIISNTLTTSGVNTLNGATTMNNTLTVNNTTNLNNVVNIGAGKQLIFANSYPDRKIILYNNNTANNYNFFGFNVDNYTGITGANLRQNVTGIIDNHTFSYSNVDGTAHVDTLRINGSGIDTVVPIKFNYGVGKKLIFYENNGANLYNNYGISIEGGAMRFNVNESVAYFKFSSANNSTTGTGFTDMLTLSGESLISNVPVISTKDTTLQHMLSPYIRTYNNQIISSSFTKNLTGLGFTIRTSSHYVKTLSVQIPLSFYCTKTDATGNYVMGFNTVQMSILRNGFLFAIPTVAYSGFYGISSTITFNAHAIPASSERFKTTASFSFNCLDYSDESVYTCQFAFTFVQSGTPAYVGCYVNSLVPLSELVNSTILTAPGLTGYVVANYVESPFQVYGGRSGQVEVNDLTVSGDSIISGDLTLVGNMTTNKLTASGNTSLSNLNYYGQAGAQLIDGVNLYSIGLPVYNSIPDLRNYYSRQGSNASGYSITTGSIYTVQLNMNDRDDIWLIMPGFRLVVYSEFTYTGVILDITNTGTVPIHTYPTSLNLASSCKIYFNGVEIV